MMGLQNKPLGEMTLSEVRALCEQQEDCDTCPFCYQDESGAPPDCRLTSQWVGLPSQWLFSFLTDRDIRIANALGARWASLDRNEEGSPPTIRCIELWKEEPNFIDDYKGKTYQGDGLVAKLYEEDMFPNLEPGDCICCEAKKADKTDRMDRKDKEGKHHNGQGHSDFKR